MKLSTIEKKVNALAHTWVGENKHIPSIIRGLNKTFNKSLVTFVSARFDQEYYEDHSVLVSAQYSPSMGMWYIPEQITVALNFPKESKKAKINEACAKNLAHKIIRAIHHEYRHKHQFRRRGFPHMRQYRVGKEDKDRLKLIYYGHFDEIDAHAYETQVDRLDINKLRKAHKIGWRESEAIYLYRKHFRKKDPKIWKKFLKKVYKNGRCIG